MTAGPVSVRALVGGVPTDVPVTAVLGAGLPAVGVDLTSDVEKASPGNPIGDKLAETVSITDLRFRKTAPELTWNGAIQRASAAAQNVRIPTGIFDVDEVQLTGGVFYDCQGRGAVLRRVANATGRYAVKAAAIASFALVNLTIDANADNQTRGGTALYVSGCSDFSLGGLRLRGHHSIDGGNLGVGLHIADCVDSALGTESRIDDVTVRGVGGATPRTLTGILVERSSNLAFSGITSTLHRYADIALDNQRLPFVGATETLISFTDIVTHGAGIGLSMLGNISFNGPNGGLFSQDSYVHAKVLINGLRASGHPFHGLSVQADGVAIGNLAIFDCGTGAAYGAVNISSRRFSICGGVLSGNTGQYGLDAGGSISGTISGLTITNNGWINPSSGKKQGIGLNLGATINLTVTGCTLDSNGGAGGGAEILASAFDGANDFNWFPWRGRGLVVKGNTIVLGHANMVGVQVVNGFLGAIVKDNTFVNDVGAVEVIAFGSPGALRVYENDVINNTSFKRTVASAATVVLPDIGNSILITGTASISNIKTRSQSVYAGKVCGAEPTAAIQFSSNPTSSLAEVRPVINATRDLIGAYASPGPATYSSPPACSFTDGTNTVSITVLLGGTNADNADEREVTLKFANAAHVVPGGNIYLSNGVEFTALSFGTSSLKLRSEFGNWYEVSRSL